MTNPRLHRLLFALILTGLTTASAIAFAGDGAEIGHATHAHIDPDTCRYARWDGRRGVTDEEVRRMIRCSVARWPVDGGLTQAFAVARCESGFDEHSRNPSSSAAGVYQFLASTWANRRGAYRELARRFDLSTSVLNARANVVVAIRYAHEGGWSPWACA